MKALTVCQPWAHVIVHGPKRVENRTLATRYAGPLLIHAGLSRSWLEFWDADLWQERYGCAHPTDREMAFGAIVGYATLLGCLNYAERHAAIDFRQNVRQFFDSRFAEGPFLWCLSDVHAFAEPIPCRGARNVWDVPPDIAAKVIGSKCTDGSVLTFLR